MTLRTKHRAAIAWVRGLCGMLVVLSGLGFGPGMQYAGAQSITPATAELTSSALGQTESTRFQVIGTAFGSLSLELCMPNCQDPTVILRNGQNGGLGQATWTLDHDCATASSVCTATVSYTAGDAVNYRAELRLTDRLATGQPVTASARLRGLLAPQSQSQLSFQPAERRGPEGSQISIVVERTGTLAELANSVVLTLINENGIARLGQDYEILSSLELRWDQGDATDKEVLIGLTADSVAEPTESFQLFMRSIDGAEPGTNTSTTVSIDDVPPGNPGIVTFDQASYTVNETAGTVQLTLLREQGSVGDVTAFYRVTGGSATLPLDYNYDTNVRSVSWNSGDSTPRTLDVSIVNDSIPEGDEDIIFEIEDTGGGLGFGQITTATVVIQDSAPPANDTIAFTSGAVSFNEDAGTVELAVQRTGNNPGNASVEYLISPGTASLTDDLDLNTLIGTLNWTISGSATQTISVPIVDDALFETDETFTVSLSLADGVDLASPDKIEVTILDNDPAPPTGMLALESAGYSVTEAEGTVTVTVLRTGGSSGEASVDFALIDGSADAIDDYATNQGFPTQGTLNWASGDAASRSITIDIATDDLVEGNEDFTVSLSNAAGATLGSPDTATVTIVDSTTPPANDTVAFTTSSVSVNEDAGTAELTVLRMGTNTGDASVGFSIAAGTASLDDDLDLAAVDLGSLTGTLNWTANSAAAQTISIPIVDDALFETDETFSLTLTNPNGLDLASPTTVDVTILNNDPAPLTDMLAFEPDSYTVTEPQGTDTGSITLTVIRSGGSSGPASVIYSLNDITAEFGVDYATTPNTTNGGTLDWAAGDTTNRTISIDIAADDLVENDEEFTVTLSGATGATIDSVNGAANVTIIDNTVPPADDTVAFTASSVSFNEDAGTAELTVQRVGNNPGAASVDFSIAAGTASLDDDLDLASVNLGSLTGTINWTANSAAAQTISIPIVDDTQFEADETFSLTLTNPNGLDLASPTTVTVTILDNDPAPPTGMLALESAGYSVTEAEGTVTVTVLRTGGSSGEASVDFALIDGSADAIDDYATNQGFPTQGTLNWASGDAASRSITIDIATDDLVEGNEDFTVSLSNAAGATLGSPDTATVTIVDSTTPPANDTVAFTTSSVSVNEDAGTAELTVLRMGTNTGDVSVDFSIAAGTASLDDDLDLAAVNLGSLTGTLNWTANSAAAQTISIPIVNDVLVELDETFTVSLNNPVGADLVAPTTVDVTIINDDVQQPGLLVFDPDTYTVSEDDSSVSVIVSRTNGADGDASVSYSVSDGSAVAGEDYATASGSSTTGTLIWADGDDSDRIITIDIAEDGLVETSETFSLALQGAVGASIDSSAMALVTIIDSTPPPLDTVVLADASINVNENAGTLELIVQRVGDGVTNASVTYSLSAGTASLFDDIGPNAAITRTLTWAAGDAGDRIISIPVVDDDLVEENETFSVVLSQPDGVTLGTPASAEVTIISDDIIEPGQLAFNPDVYSVTEDAGSITVTVARTGGSDGATTVSYLVSDGTALAGEDYAQGVGEGEGSTNNGTLNWTDGDSSDRLITLDILSDDVVEPSETFTIALMDVSGAALGDADSALVTIIDSTERSDFVMFAASSDTVNENAGTIDVVVQRVGNGDTAASVDYTISAGSASLTDDLDIGNDSSGTLTWLDADQSSRLISVAIVNDDNDESDETFAITLSEPDGAELGQPASIELTVIDDDEPPTPGVLVFDPDAYTVSEADGSVSLSVSRVNGTDGSASVSYTIANGTAIAGSDFAAAAGATTSGTFSWANADATDRTITIDIAADEIVESNETFTVSLQGSSGAGIGSADIATVTILDNTTVIPDTIVFADGSYSVNEAAGNLELIVQRVGAGIGSVSVDYALSAGTASLSADIDAAESTGGTLSWADGDSSDRVISIAIVDDDEVETDETLSATLSQVVNANLGQPQVADITIIDNDETPEPPVQPGTLQFAAASITVDEDASSVTVTVTRTGGSDGAVSIGYNTDQGTATLGEDYANTTGMLNWADGDAAPKSFDIAVNEDAIDEGAEQFVVTLQNAQPLDDSVLIGSPALVTVTINNVAPPVITPPTPVNPGTLQFAQPTLSVGENDSTVTLRVLRTGGSDGAVSVQFASSDGSAAAEVDYQPVSGTLFWDDGDAAAKSFTINVNDDTDIEDVETVIVTLFNSQPTADLLGTPNVLTLSITDDTEAPVEPEPLPVAEPGQLSFEQADVSVAEADGSITLSVARTGGSDGMLSVDYALVAGSASLGADVVDQSDTLTWVDGDATPRTITLTINADVLPEEDEQFVVSLSNAVPAGDTRIITGEVTVTITDSTNVGVLRVAAQSVSVLESTREVTVEIARVEGSDGPVQVEYELVPGTAEAGVDYTATNGVLEWANGETGVRFVRIAVLEDNLEEVTETLLVRFFNATPLGAGQLPIDQVAVSILDSTLPADLIVEPLAELGSLTLQIVSGDGQGGLPGDTLEPLVIRAVDTADNNTAVPNIPVRWRVNPEGSAELIGSGADRTITDANGNASATVRILSRGFLNIIASVDVAAESQALASRINPPDFAGEPGDAVFTVRAGIGAALGLQPNQAAVGFALDEACEALGVILQRGDALTAEQQDLFATCQEIESRLNDQANVSAALERLTPEAALFIGDSIIDTADIQITNVYSRINAIRSGQVEQLDLSNLSFRIYNEQLPGSVINAAQNALSGGGASGDEQPLYSRLGVFVNGAISFGEVDGDDNQKDADVRTSGITVGADYRLSDSAVLGAGIGFAHNDTEFTPDEGDASLTGVNLTLFGTWYEADEGYVDAVFDIGRNSYDIRRRINLPDLPDQFGVGSTDADVISLTIGFGRDFSRGGWEFGPYGRMSLISADVGGYSERAVGDESGFGSVLDISSHSVRSTRFSIGGQLSRSINTRHGIFVPQLRVEAEFESEENKDGIEATFQHDPSQTPFIVNGNPRDTSYLNLGIGGSALMTNGKSGYLFYETRAQHDYVTQHWLKVGLRLEF